MKSRFLEVFVMLHGPRHLSMAVWNLPSKHQSVLAVPFIAGPQDPLEGGRASPGIIRFIQLRMAGIQMLLRGPGVWRNDGYAASHCLSHTKPIGLVSTAVNEGI